MRLKSGLTLRKIGSRYMIVDASTEVVNMTNVYTLNEVAAWLWNEAQKADFTGETLVSALCDEYDVDYETACGDVDKLIALWSEYGWLE